MCRLPARHTVKLARYPRPPRFEQSSHESIQLCGEFVVHRSPERSNEGLLGALASRQKTRQFTAAAINHVTTAEKESFETLRGKALDLQLSVDQRSAVREAKDARDRLPAPRPVFAHLRQPSAPKPALEDGNHVRVLLKLVHEGYPRDRVPNVVCVRSAPKPVERVEGTDPIAANIGVHTRQRCMRAAPLTAVILARRGRSSTRW